MSPSHITPPTAQERCRFWTW